MTRRRLSDSFRSARLEERRGGLPAGLGAVSLLIAEFEDWACQWQEDPARWTAFDRFVREQLYSTLSATRVRCYHIIEQGASLESLSPSREPFAASLSAREGIYGYVISRGYRYIRHDELLGPAVHQLADQSPDPPMWCFPITYDHGVHGLVSVGAIRPRAAADIGLLESVGGVVSLLWCRLADHERIVVTGRTDQGSGVLSRARFFEQAERALADGFASHEPSLAVALTLEGIRRLDDTGLWEPRDRAITAAGQALHSKLRSDDVVGRFADDRFVVLMRRLDTSLGRMIAHKLLQAVQESLAAADPCLRDVVVRCGLAGPGQKQPTLQELLSKAFNAVNRARHAGVHMWDDLDEERENPT
jgi:diguanylate cyclase (GGDEF)-like protein